jgi:hypothetical protein
MLWQDAFCAGIQILLSISLVPQVYDGFRKKVGPIKFLTSIPTFLGLYCLAGIYITLSLYFTAAMTFLCATLWFLLFLQRVFYTSNKIKK